MNPAQSVKRRSNRPITQFACGCLDLFLSIPTYETERSRADTKITAWKESDFHHFLVEINGHKVFKLDSFCNEPVSLEISTEGNIEPDGQLVDSLVERSNGLLDLLGHRGVIPMGVRVFGDREDSVFYIGKGEDRLPISLDYANKVKVEPCYNELRMLPQ